MDSSDTIGVCVVGAGRAGMIHAQNLCGGRIPGARLVAVSDPDAGQRRLCGEALQLDMTYDDYRVALADKQVDAVIVAPPTMFHCVIVLAAAAAGKSVIC